MLEGSRRDGAPPGAAAGAAEAPVERLHGAGGRVTGVSTLVVVALVVAMGVLEESIEIADWFYAGLALLVVLTWGACLRPGVLLGRDHLVLRNMYETVTVPLVSVTTIELRSVLVVRTAGGRFVSPAIGRSRRQLAGGRAPGTGGLTRILGRGRNGVVPDPEAVYTDFVEQRIEARAADSRARAGLPARRDDDESVPPAHRRPAWPEIVATALAVLALVVTLVL